MDYSVNQDLKTEIKNRLNKIHDEKALIQEFGLPIAGFGLPKQKPLKRITQEILKHSGLVFWDRPSRIDHSYAYDTNSQHLLRVTIDHTIDALSTINNGGGVIKATYDSSKKIPFIAIVGYDGFSSQRYLAQENGRPWFARVKKPLQSTQAGLVLAARQKHSLVNLGKQTNIAVAATYEGIYRGFLREAFGKQSDSIILIPRKGGTEGSESFIEKIEVIGDLTDSGASLKKNGLDYVIPVSDSAPVIITHNDWVEHVKPKQIRHIEDLVLHFQRASETAFPNEKLFDMRPSSHTNDSKPQRDKGIEKRIISLDEYLKSRGKTGTRADAEIAAPFYDLKM